MELLHSANRDRISTRKFELRTAPELARARFDLVCRRTDGRRRESVQGRATTREQLGNVRNVVAFLSPRLQLLLVRCKMKNQDATISYK